jgi:hypothetical protein
MYEHETRNVSLADLHSDPVQPISNLEMLPTKGGPK